MFLPKEIFLILGFVWSFFSDWWWLIAPPVLALVINDLWLFYKKNEYIFYTMEWTLLEIHLPQIVERTPQAMEQVFAGFHGIYTFPKWFERYGQGKQVAWISCEIVSTGGDTHFFIRCLTKHRNLVEANIWAQYPDAEIHEVDDYVHTIPRQVPNEEWNLWGGELVLLKPDPYPIRTFEEFESPVEEQRLDPLSSMLEVMSSLGPGEHLWFQIVAQPVFGPWEEAAEEEINKLIGVKGKPKRTMFSFIFDSEIGRFLGDVVADFIGAVSPGGPGEEGMHDKKDDREDQWAMFRLTPGQQDQLKALERNIGKLGFKVNLRFQYAARRDVFAKVRVNEFFGTMRQFNSESLNSIVPNKSTMPDVEFQPFAKQRNYRRRRLLDRHIRYRLFRKHTYTFNTEELATIFHFPGIQVTRAPSISRIESKRGEPPATLPTT